MLVTDGLVPVFPTPVAHRGHCTGKAALGRDLPDHVLAVPRPSPDMGASRPTGFRRQPLLEPCMNLSTHTAPIRRTCRSCRYASERTGSSSPGPAFVENGWRVFCEP